MKTSFDRPTMVYQGPDTTDTHHHLEESEALSNLSNALQTLYWALDMTLLKEHLSSQTKY